VFSEAKERSLELLQQTWIRFLKQDFKNFLELVTAVTEFCYGLTNDNDNYNYFFIKTQQYYSKLLRISVVILK